MPVPLSKFKEMLKIAFKELIDVCLAEDIKNEIGKKFVVFSQRSIHTKDRLGNRQTISNYDCLVVGQILDIKVKYDNPRYTGPERIPYSELPSGKLRNLSPGAVVYMFPDDILEAILFNDYLSDITED